MTAPADTVASLPVVRRITGASLRDRAGRPSARAMLRCLGYSATIACAALGGCDADMLPPKFECVNIVSHERLTNTDQRSPDEPFSFNGTDWQGYRRFVSSEDRKWWKCRKAREGAAK